MRYPSGHHPQAAYGIMRHEAILEVQQVDGLAISIVVVFVRAPRAHLQDVVAAADVAATADTSEASTALVHGINTASSR